MLWSSVRVVLLAQVLVLAHEALCKISTTGFVRRMCVYKLFVLKMIMLTNKLCGFNTRRHVTDPASLSIGPNNSQRQYWRGLCQLQQASSVGLYITHVTFTLTIPGGGGPEMIEKARVLTFWLARLMYCLQ